MKNLDHKKATPLAFIPSPFYLKDRPELAICPLNIIYMSIAIIDGLDTRGTAIYWPDLQAYRQSDFESSLRYFNQYGRQDYIDVQHSVEFGRYMGEKYIHGKNVATTYGTTWKSFFIHLTMTGLTEGEQCEFSPIDKISKVW